jgi:hypothetical protein
MDPEKVDDMLKARAATQSPSSANTAPGHAFTIAVALSKGNVRVVRRAVVQFTGDETKPYWLLAWN